MRIFVIWFESNKVRRLWPLVKEFGPFFNVQTMQSYTLLEDTILTCIDKNTHTYFKNKIDGKERLKTTLLRSEEIKTQGKFGTKILEESFYRMMALFSLHIVKVLIATKIVKHAFKLTTRALNHVWRRWSAHGVKTLGWHRWRWSTTHW